jgi:transcriptional regulator with XRE-family HTH domain
LAVELREQRRHPLALVLGSLAEDARQDLGRSLSRKRPLRSSFSRARLAGQCGLHRTFIGSVERGERNVSVLNLRLIARVLRVKLADLFSEPPQAGQA